MRHQAAPPTTRQLTYPLLVAETTSVGPVVGMNVGVVAAESVTHAQSHGRSPNFVAILTEVSSERFPRTDGRPEILAKYSEVFANFDFGHGYLEDHT